MKTEDRRPSKVSFTGARSSECTRGLKTSVVYHRTNNPVALKVKKGVRTGEHGSRREHRMSREPPGYYFGKRVLLSECSCRWSFLERRAVHFGFSHGAASSREGCWIFLSADKTVYYTNSLLERAEQDGGTIRRAAHRSRAQACSSS